MPAAESAALMPQSLPARVLLPDGSERTCEVLEFTDLDYVDLKFVSMDLRASYRAVFEGKTEKTP